MDLRCISSDAAPLFRLQLDDAKNDRRGAVAVVLTCGRETRTTREQANAYVDTHLSGHHLLDIVFGECTMPMTSDNSGLIAHEIFTLLREKLRATYRNCDAWALLIDGPGPLALAIGRAVDKVIGGDEPVHVPILAGRDFAPAIILSLKSSEKKEKKKKQAPDFLRFRKPNRYFSVSDDKPNGIQVILLVTDNEHEQQQTLRVLCDESKKADVPFGRWSGQANANQPTSRYYFGQMGKFRVVVAQCA